MVQVLFKKLIVTQIVKKYPAFFWNPKVHSQKPSTVPYPEIAEANSPRRSLSP
jgi:hypothetical protein